MRLRSALALAVLAVVACADLESAPLPEQSRPPVPEIVAGHQVLARAVIDGQRARDMVSFMEPHFRLPGNRGFDASIERVVAELEDAGYRNEADAGMAPLTYRVERRPMDRPTWEPVSGSLRVVGSDDALLHFETNRNLVAINSFSTPPGGVEADLIDLGSGTAADFDREDVRGRIVLADMRVGRLFTEAVVERGALGVIAYAIPSLNRPEENRDVIGYSSIPLDAGARSWGLQLTTNARDALRDAMREGPLRVRVEVEARTFESAELTLVADVRGRTEPDERFVFSAHVQEAGANDNASGVAALSEVARVFAEGVRSGSFVPDRTISMIWGDEIRSTRRYLNEDPGRTAGILWGMSLDMVGEDTQRTGGTFLIEKMPDPSAVWTRGEDRHTEWGGRPMSVDQLTPHYFNDFVLNRCRDQGADNGWVVRTNPFEGGSDHVPFLRAGLAGILLWHFTDVYYHTDGDRLINVSPATLENVGVCASVAAMTLTTADADVAAFLVHEVERAALERLDAETVLGLDAVAGGGDRAEETRILDAWTTWYLAAIDSMADIEVGGPSPVFSARIAAARATIAEKGEAARAAVDEAGESF